MNDEGFRRAGDALARDQDPTGRGAPQGEAESGPAPSIAGPGAGAEEIAVRMEMPLAVPERLAELLPRMDDELRQRVLDQLWLKTVLTEQLRRTNRAERPAFIERGDRLLEQLDPTDDDAAADRWRADPSLVRADLLQLPGDAEVGPAVDASAVAGAVLHPLGGGREAFGHLDWPTYDVRALAREPEYINPLCDECDGEGTIGADETTCERCEGTGDLEDEARYETPDEVGIRTDPIPHYKRGRTRLTPAPEGRR